MSLNGADYHRFRVQRQFSRAQAAYDAQEAPEYYDLPEDAEDEFENELDAEADDDDYASDCDGYDPGYDGILGEG